MSGNSMLMSNTCFMSLLLVASVVQNYFVRLSEVLRRGCYSTCDIYNEASVCLKTWRSFFLPAILTYHFS